MRILTIGFLFLAVSFGAAAEPITPDLSTLAGNQAGWEMAEFRAFGAPLASSGKANVIQSVAMSGAYVADREMTDGTIELEIRGRAADGSSFVGVIFHGVDGVTYDGIYFRSFNFGHSNAAKRSHAVQYIAMPEWPWYRLRREKPDQYEQPVNPEPKPDEWFRARIVIEGDRVRAYVNDASEPSLDVRKLNARRTGKVGIWFTGFGDIANLKITPVTSAP